MIETHINELKYAEEINLKLLKVTQLHSHPLAAILVVLSEIISWRETSKLSTNSTIPPLGYIN